MPSLRGKRCALGDGGLRNKVGRRGEFKQSGLHSLQWGTLPIAPPTEVDDHNPIWVKSQRGRPNRQFRRDSSPDPRTDFSFNHLNFFVTAQTRGSVHLSR